jgi:threonine/homoserine/homoserine lactone efflux protein
LPQFASPARGSVAAQLLMLGMLFNISGTLVNAAVALAASRAGAWSRQRLRGGGLLQRLTGVVFVGLGVRLAFQQRP